jgi:hypothetical protein
MDIVIPVSYYRKETEKKCGGGVLGAALTF